MHAVFWMENWMVQNRKEVEGKIYTLFRVDIHTSFLIELHYKKFLLLYPELANTTVLNDPLEPNCCFHPENGAH